MASRMPSAYLGPLPALLETKTNTPLSDYWQSLQKARTNGKRKCPMLNFQSNILGSPGKTLMLLAAIIT